MSTWHLPAPIPAAVIADGPCTWVVDNNLFAQWSDGQAMLIAMDVVIAGGNPDPVPDQGAVAATLTKVSTTGDTTDPIVCWGPANIRTATLARIVATGILISP